MSSRQRRVAACLALAAIACGGGPSAEAKLFQQQKAVCVGLASSGKTFAQAFQDIAGTRPGFAYTSECHTGLLATSSDDHCNYANNAVVCESFVQWQAFDNDLCSTNGCVYFCELRTQESTPVANPTVDTTPICATRFVSGQPF
jgi:hypothetical protein